MSAPFGRRDLELAATRRVGAYWLLSAVDGSGVVPVPGQFYMLSATRRWGGGDDERPFVARACSVLRVEGAELQFLLEIVGPGTARLCELRAGEGLSVVGPLGRGFRAPAADGRTLLVGGGIGIAPLAILQDAIRAESRDHSVLLGFRDAAHAEAAGLLPGAVVATDDGSVGYHGLVTELLQGELDHHPIATVYACGPPAMLEAVRALCEEHATPAQLALESGMACGFGACFGCVVPTRGGGYARVCVDGPVLDADRLASALAPEAA